jgi:hypothetical protein
MICHFVGNLIQIEGDYIEEYHSERDLEFTNGECEDNVV